MLVEMIHNIREQTYRPIEAIIVADGPDPELFDLLIDKADEWGQTLDPERAIRVIFAQLGFHSSSLLTNSISALPFATAQALATGDYQITLSDDERFLVPDAIEKLVDNLERNDCDFAYSKAEITYAWNDRRDVIGCNPPQCGQITQFLIRREMLDRGALFQTHVGSGTDWNATYRMMQSGARWVFVPEVLLTHRADK
jgi:hypothetical protein